MKKLFAATAAVTLLAASVAQATGPLPDSVLDFVDYICDLEDDYVIPPPFGDSGDSSSDVIFEQAFSAYVEAGLISEIPSCCDVKEAVAD